MRGPGHEQPDTHGFSGAILAAGAVLLFVGTLFYIRLTPELGLPTMAASRLQARADALTVGPRAMFLAGGFAFFGDVLLTAAAMALLGRRRGAGSDLEAVGWTLFAMGAGIAIVFDSMMAVLLAPLAALPDPGTFVAFKGWFDLLFASGNVPYGLGAIAVLVADMRADRPLLPKALAIVGILIGAAAAVSGAGYVAGIMVAPTVIGLSVTFGCVVFAVFGAQLARGASTRSSPARTSTLAASATAG